MSTLKLTDFSGEQLGRIPRLMASTAAKRAIDARLEDGSLSPFRKDVHEHTFSFDEEPTPYDTIYLFGEEWLGFVGHVHLAKGPVASERLYYTGDGAPKIRVGEDIYDLAVPRPAAALTATPAGSGSAEEVTRVYVYTYVTEFGEESEPSPLSDEITFPGDESVTLSDFETVPDDRAITKQRIYRSQTGTAGTDLYFIAERDASTDNFVDDIPVDEFAEPLPSRNWNPPPAGLAGLIALPNGMMAGFTGRELCLSEPNRPHAWPEVYRLTTDFPIVALGAIGTDIIVTTTGIPYRVSGTSPESMAMQKIEINLPCINARGLVDLGYAVAWPSYDGLAVVKADGGVGIITENIFTPEKWRALIPGTLRAGQLAGRWLGSFDTLDEDGNPFTGTILIDIQNPKPFLIRAAPQARSWFYDVETGGLYFLAADGITVRRFDAGGPALLYWRSKEFILPNVENFGAILIETAPGASEEAIAAALEEMEAIEAANALLIEAGSVSGDLGSDVIGVTTVGGDILADPPPPIGTSLSVGVFADGVKVATVGVRDTPTRLPAGFKARKWEVDVLSDITIDQITVARTMDELAQQSGLA